MLKRRNRKNRKKRLPLLLTIKRKTTKRKDNPRLPPLRTKNLPPIKITPRLNQPKRLKSLR
jgi:hypothetical protein